jgi:hypothetical protein
MREHPILREGKEPPACSTVSCHHSAAYLCIWGCLEAELHDGFYCTSCALAKQDRVHRNISYGGNMVCMYGHTIVDFVQVKLTDPWREMFDHHGVRVYDD